MLQTTLSTRKTSTDTKTRCFLRYSDTFALETRPHCAVSHGTLSSAFPSKTRIIHHSSCYLPCYTRAFTVPPTRATALTAHLECTVIRALYDLFARREHPSILNWVTLYQPTLTTFLHLQTQKQKPLLIPSITESPYSRLTCHLLTIFTSPILYCTLLPDKSFIHTSYHSRLVHPLPDPSSKSVPTTFP